MRLNCFEQLLFWYFIIKNKEECSFLDIILNEELVTEFMEFYGTINVDNNNNNSIKDIGASTMANHYGNYATFCKWLITEKDYKDFHSQALMC